MRHRLLSTSTVVAPLGAPQRVYGLSVVGFDADVPYATPALYSRLAAGAEIPVVAFGLNAFEAEEPSLLLAERQLRLVETGPGVWRLSLTGE